MEPTPDGPRLYPLNALLNAFTQDAQARYDAKQQGMPLGAQAGHPRLNREIGGAFAPGLHILHGAPGSGKSAFALQIAATCGCPCLYVTCEMAPLELLRRVTARVTKTYLGRFKSGDLPPAEAQRLACQACDKTPLLGLLDVTSAAAPPDILLTSAAAMRRADSANPHLLIIVDSVHSWVRGLPAATLTETEALIAGLDALRALAQRQNCALIGIAERNRASMKSEGQNAAAGTRVFEYAAETVFALAADKETPDANGIMPITLTIGKNRNGTPGKKITYQFHGATQTFTEGD